MTGAGAQIESQFNMSHEVFALALSLYVLGYVFVHHSLRTEPQQSCPELVELLTSLVRRSLVFGSPPGSKLLRTHVGALRPQSDHGGQHGTVRTVQHRLRSVSKHPNFPRLQIVSSPPSLPFPKSFTTAAFEGAGGLPLLFIVYRLCFSSACC